MALKDLMVIVWLGSAILVPPVYCQFRGRNQNRNQGRSQQQSQGRDQGQLQGPRVPGCQRAGVFPIEGICDAYLSCPEGSRFGYRMPCPGGTSFDSRSSNCINTANSDCRVPVVNSNDNNWNRNNFNNINNNNNNNRRTDQNNRGRTNPFNNNRGGTNPFNNNRGRTNTNNNNNQGRTNRFNNNRDRTNTNNNNNNRGRTNTNTNNNNQGRTNPFNNNRIRTNTNNNNNQRTNQNSNRIRTNTNNNNNRRRTNANNNNRVRTNTNTNTRGRSTFEEPRGVTIQLNNIPTINCWQIQASLNRVFRNIVRDEVNIQNPDLPNLAIVCPPQQFGQNRPTQNQQNSPGWLRG